MERNRFRYCRLNAYYGGLLTARQAEIFLLHYEDDFSLAEIAEKLNITRQAVLDNLRHTESTLDKAENKLGLMARDDLIRKNLEKINEAIKNKDLTKANELVEVAIKDMED